MIVKMIKKLESKMEKIQESNKDLEDLEESRRIKEQTCRDKQHNY